MSTFGSVVENKVKGQNFKFATFQINSSQLPTVKFLSQYWQNCNTEVRVILLTLNCIILKKERCRNFKFGENAFQALPNILVKSEKLLNAALKIWKFFLATQGWNILELSVFKLVS